MTLPLEPSVAASACTAESAASGFHGRRRMSGMGIIVLLVVALAAWFLSAHVNARLAARSQFMSQGSSDRHTVNNNTATAEEENFAFTARQLRRVQQRLSETEAKLERTANELRAGKAATVDDAPAKPGHTEAGFPRPAPITARAAWCWIMVCRGERLSAAVAVTPLTPFCMLPSVQSAVSAFHDVRAGETPKAAPPRSWTDLYNYARPSVPDVARANVCSGSLQHGFLTAAGAATTAARAKSDLAHCAALMAHKKNSTVRVTGTLGRRVVTKGPGGCGGPPYLSTTKGTFEECAKACQRNLDCDRFQRERSSGTCYLASKNSSTQAAEPNGAGGWECGFTTSVKPEAWGIWTVCMRCKAGEDPGLPCKNFCSQAGHCGQSAAFRHVDCSSLSDGAAHADVQLWKAKGCSEWLPGGATPFVKLAGMYRAHRTVYEENSPRAPIQKMTEQDLQTFHSNVRIDRFLPNKPVKMSNVCLSPRDGWILPLPPGSDPANNPVGLAALFDPDTLQHKQAMKWLSGPDIPRAMKHADFVRLKNVRHVPGESAAVNCYRCDEGTSNPAHYLMGYTRLFEGSLLRKVPKLTTLVFHQCMPRRLFALGALYWKYVARRLTEAGRWYGEDATNLITIGANLDGGWSAGPSKMTQPGDDVTCFESLHADLWHTGSYLLDEEDRRVWHSYSREASEGAHLHGSVPVVWDTSPATAITAPHILPPAPLNYTVHKRLRDGSLAPLECSHACTDNLRIGVWHRTEGNHMRRFTNEDDVVAMLQNYTRLPVKLYSLNSRTPAEEQMVKFAEFDLMVTTHGSQMTNMVFSKENATVVEVMAVPFDQSICSNAVAWSKVWIQSHGHTPATNGQPNHRLVSVIYNITHGLVSSASASENGLEYEGYKNTDLIVDLERLKEDVELAIAKRCDCPTLKLASHCAPREWKAFPWKAFSA